MKATVALEYPVETILSGPAASVVGAGFLTGLRDFIVSDMGGTTTDIAVVRAGRPVISGEGALVGGWRTMVEAVDVRTTGLGGDSEVGFDAKHRLRVGPRKVMPLCLLAHQFPAALPMLKLLSEQERLPAHPAHFALRNPGRAAPAHLSSLERRVLEALAAEPKRLSDITRSGSGLEALRRLADAGLATIAAFTPTDAMHVLERQRGWCCEASEYGARILAIEERNTRAAREAATPRTISERTAESVVRATGRALLGAALGTDPGMQIPPRGWGELGERLIEETVAGQRFSALLETALSLATPLVGIGAPVGAYYPEVARRLKAQLSIPEHAAVCNAVGAVAGIVSQSAEVLVNQTSFQVFRVHDPSGIRDYGESSPALEHARRVSREIALAAAKRAGAADPQVETVVIEKLAQVGPGADYLAEARVRSTATGRPLAESPS